MADRSAPAAGPGDPGTERRLLRHALATLAYRAGKTLRGAPPGFAGFSCGQGCRTPAETLAHMGDLLEWAEGLVRGELVWNPAPPRAWDEETERFFAHLARFDAALAAGDAALPTSAGRLFQAPIADCLTHVGQLALLRRLAGAPVRGENYFQAEITVGRVGPEQTPPEYEID